MAFRELVRRLLVANVTMGVLLLVSYASIALTNVSADRATYVIIQFGAILIAVNFVLLILVLYTGWEPV